MIQSCNVSNQKSQTLKDENFTKFLYSMMMEEFEYCNLLKQLNEKQRLIFDDVMYKKNYIFIYQFVYFLQRVLEPVKFLHLKDYYNYTINTYVLT